MCGNYEKETAEMFLVAFSESEIQEESPNQDSQQNFAKRILDYWGKRGTEQTILFLEDIVGEK